MLIADQGSDKKQKHQRRYIKHTKPLHIKDYIRKRNVTTTQNLQPQCIYSTQEQQIPRSTYNIDITITTIPRNTYNI